MSSITEQWLFEVHPFLNTWMNYRSNEPEALLEMFDQTEHPLTDEQRDWVYTFVNLYRRCGMIKNPKNGVMYSIGAINVHLMMYLMAQETVIHDLRYRVKALEDERDVFDENDVNI